MKKRAAAGVGLRLKSVEGKRGGRGEEGVHKRNLTVDHRRCRSRGGWRRRGRMQCTGTPSGEELGLGTCTGESRCRPTMHPRRLLRACGRLGRLYGQGPASCPRPRSPGQQQRRRASPTSPVASSPPDPERATFPPTPTPAVADEMSVDSGDNGRRRERER